MPLEVAPNAVCGTTGRAGVRDGDTTSLRAKLGAQLAVLRPGDSLISKRYADPLPKARYRHCNVVALLGLLAELAHAIKDAIQDRARLQNVSL